MTAQDFARSVLPVVLADYLLCLAHQLLVGGSDDSWPSWVVGAISLSILPAWAGARVARFGGSLGWSCLGGLCLFLGVAVLAIVNEFYEPVLRDLPPVLLVGTVLVLVLSYALFGFLGGKLSSRGKARVAR